MDLAVLIVSCLNLTILLGVVATGVVVAGRKKTAAAKLKTQLLEVFAQKAAAERAVADG
jgi:hypothetical protein